MRLGKTQVVIGSDIESSGRRSCVYLSTIKVFGISVVDQNGSASDTSDRLGEAVVYALLEATRIKRIEVGIQRCVSLTDISNGRRTGRQRRRTSYGIKWVKEDFANRLPIKSRR